MRKNVVDLLRPIKVWQTQFTFLQISHNNIAVARFDARTGYTDPMDEKNRGKVFAIRILSSTSPLPSQPPFYLLTNTPRSNQNVKRSSIPLHLPAAMARLIRKRLFTTFDARPALSVCC